MNSPELTPEKSHRPHLVWVYAGNLQNALDSATWLNTTQELRRLGWQVDLVVHGQPGRDEIDGVEVTCFPAPDIYFLRQMIFHLQLVWYLLLHWNRTDLILFNQTSAMWLFPLKLIRHGIFRKTPRFVLDTRTVPMEDFQTATLRDRIRGKYYNWTNQLANRLADGQTAITYRMAEKVAIPSDKLWGVWPSGADTELFTSAMSLRSWPPAGGVITLIYIGVLHYERNLLNLSKAVEKAHQAGMKFHLILAGNGTEKADLELFARKTEGRIQVFDPVPHAQVPQLLAKAHIGVLPFPDDEKYRVSSPIKLFEYMASGLAIMATRIACHTDIIRNGRYCFWCEEASADGLFVTLEDIWFNQSQLMQMGAEAREASQNWTWAESARKLSQALLFGFMNDQPVKRPILPRQTPLRRR